MSFKKRKFISKKIKKKRIKEYLNKEVFNTLEFKEHVYKVSLILGIKEDVVQDVLSSYFTSIFVFINSINKKTKINIYGFFSLFTEKDIIIKKDKENDKIHSTNRWRK